jgi:hypothetical protein
LVKITVRGWECWTDVIVDLTCGVTYTYLASLQLSAANTQDYPHVLSYSAVVPLLLAPPPGDVFARMFLYLGFSGASLSSVLFLLFSLQNCCARHSSLTIKRILESVERICTVGVQ